MSVTVRSMSGAAAMRSSAGGDKNAMCCIGPDAFSSCLMDCLAALQSVPAESAVSSTRYAQVTFSLCSFETWFLARRDVVFSVCKACGRVALCRCAFSTDIVLLKAGLRVRTPGLGTTGDGAVCSDSSDCLCGARSYGDLADFFVGLDFRRQANRVGYGEVDERSGGDALQRGR